MDLDVEEVVLLVMEEEVEEEGREEGLDGL